MSEATKFQANFKLADGTLVNIYADTSAEFETQLGNVQDMAALIHSVSQSLGSAGPGRSFPSRGNYSKPAPATPAPEIVEGQAPTCKHGAMTFREGVSAKGPWKGWMCPAPKGTPDKCDAIFVR